MASETPRNTHNHRGEGPNVTSRHGMVRTRQVDQEAQGLSRMVSWTSCRFFWVKEVPPPPKLRLPPRNKGLMFGLIKGNQWVFIVPKIKAELVELVILLDGIPI